MTHKKVLRNSLIYTFNNLLLKAFNFLLLPLYTAFLTPQDYGVTNLLASFTQVSTYLIAFSLYSATIRFYADLKGDGQRLKEFYGTMLCFVALSGLVFLGMFLIFQKFLLAVFFQGIPFYPTVLLGLVALLGTSLYTMYQDILKGMQLAKKSAITSLSYFFLQVALNILFVAILKFGANGVLLSLVISNTVAIVWMLFDLGKHHLFCFCINKQLLREALHYSIPIIPHNLSTHIAQFVSRVFINANTSLVSVGLFGLASKFGSLADMVQNSVNMAFQPWFFEQLSKREALDTKQIVSLSNSLVWLYGIVFLGLALFSQELIALMATDAYQSSWMLVPLIVAVFAIKTPYYFYINILFYYKKAAKYIFIATVSSSLLNVFLSYFFIKAWGMFGSVAADAIAMLLRVGIVVYLANKFSKIGYSLIRFGLHFLFLLLCMVVGLYPSYVQGNASVSIGACLYKIGVLIVFCIIALWANKGSVGGTLAILRKRR
jgi:O-antigen/teichoic acid export membrane protein